MKRIEFDTRHKRGTKHQKGYLINLPGYEPFRFGIHKVKCSFNSRERWVVTELSTGYAVGGTYWDRGRTIKAAIAEAKEILDRVGKIALVNNVREILKKYGELNQCVGA